MLDDFAAGLVADISKVTDKWRKQNEREIRDANAQSRRRETFIRTKPITIQDAAWKVMPTAYNKASAGGTLPVRPRQIMYAARGYIQEKTGRQLDDRYFTPDHPARLRGPDRRSIGTSSGMPAAASTSLIRTGTCRSGPWKSERTSAARRASICRPIRPAAGRPPVPRIGMAPSCSSRRKAFCRCSARSSWPSGTTLRSCRPRAVSTTAARTLIDRLVGAKVPVFCIRDFDVSGFTIAGTLRRGTRRYSWRSKGAIDLGLRLEDIQKYALESEDVYYRGANGRTLIDDQSIRLKIRDQLKANGATKEEIEFLLHHRVELNAFASDQLVEWIEEKLVEHGVEKVVPEEETLAKAVRGFARDLIAKRYLDTFAADIDREVDAAALALTGLAPAVLKMLEEDQALPWDKALAHIVQAHMGPRP